MTASPSFFNCDKCNPKRHVNTKNTIVCIDGMFDGNGTNVKKLFIKIDKQEQRTYYSKAIATHIHTPGIVKRIKNEFVDAIDMVISWNMDVSIKKAYRWLAQSYKDGDRIYFFGFSRGAYHVRVLVDMIHEVGLIKEVTEGQIGAAYDHYREILSGNLEARSIAKHFKDTFSWKNARVHFVGVWDTAPLGLLKNSIFLSASSSVTYPCHLRHALALDERHATFIPRYFHEMNSPSTDERSSPGGAQPTSEIKEVWFAGSHSDVGGANRSGKSYSSGNVSLLWMRREAAVCGLKLEPTDLAWDLDDLEFGTTNFVTLASRIIEYLPGWHQSCSGKDTLRAHQFQPRRIIPGQKVHASVLYANSYIPTATLGEGFDIPVVQPGHEDAELDSGLWETGFFDDTTAKVLLDHLGSQQGFSLDRLLFMLRFKEGKECIRNVPGWRAMFMERIESGSGTPLARLITLVAFHEASCDVKTHPDRCEPFPEQLSHDIFVEAQTSLTPTNKYQDESRVLTLFRPLTKHQVLRRQILTDQVLENLMPLFDAIVREPTGNFGKAMNGLNCLLQCEDTRSFIIEKLGETPEGFQVSRLARILEVDDPGSLTAALRMVLALSQIPDARPVCSLMLPRIVHLASKSDRFTGQLAVEILLALYYPTEQYTLNIRNAHFRANLASVLVHRHGSANDQGRPRQEVLSQLFGLNSIELSDSQKSVIGELKTAVEKGNARERTTATLTLLKLCETEAIRNHLCTINLLELFIKQLRREDSALLAAYALSICLKYADMKGPIQDNDDFPTCIVAMLAFDYFDDAVGQVRGFQIFREFMHHADLRKKINNYKITEILDMKLGSGRPREIRTSLICLDIFHSFDPNCPWTDKLVESSLERLTNPVWKVQKAGAAILSALAKTEHGVATISLRIHEIVEMLLVQGNDPPPVAPDRPSSSILGPACALLVLVKNETLRIRVRQTSQYASFKDLYLSGVLVVKVETSAWRMRSPNRNDVSGTLDKLINLVDWHPSEGVVSISDPSLPHTGRWDRFVLALRDQRLAVIAALPITAGVPVLSRDPHCGRPHQSNNVSVQAFNFVGRLRSRNPDRRALESSPGRGSTPQLEHAGEAGLGSHPEECSRDSTERRGGPSSRHEDGGARAD